jgi:hypothetical protein
MYRGTLCMKKSQIVIIEEYHIAMEVEFAMEVK